MSQWIEKSCLFLAVALSLAVSQFAVAQDLFPDKALEAAVRREVFASVITKKH